MVLLQMKDGIRLQMKAGVGMRAGLLLPAIIGSPSPRDATTKIAIPARIRVAAEEEDGAILIGLPVERERYRAGDRPDTREHLPVNPPDVVLRSSHEGLTNLR